MACDCIICKDGRKGVCESCKKEMERVSYNENGIQSYYRLKSPLGEAFKRYKFNGKKHYAREFGKIFCQDIDESQYDIITFVPLHFARYKERGFNQCKEVLKNGGIKAKKIMIKRTSKQQATLKKEQRQENIKNKFIVIRNISGKKILLIDDIYTTGATLNECIKTLKLQGAMKVDTITFLC